MGHCFVYFGGPGAVPCYNKQGAANRETIQLEVTGSKIHAQQERWYGTNFALAKRVGFERVVGLMVQSSQSGPHKRITASTLQLP